MTRGVGRLSWIIRKAQVPVLVPTSAGGLAVNGAFCHWQQVRSDLEGLGTGAGQQEKRKRPFSSKKRKQPFPHANEKSRRNDGSLKTAYRCPLIYGFPFASGALARPMNPASARIVKTYGKINRKTFGIS